MTTFARDRFHNYGGYLTYWAPDTPRPVFIARFKYARDGVATFITHLIKHHTVEGYLAAIEAGVTPLHIVQETGYLLPHIKKWLKARGYPVTLAGYDAMLTAQVEKSYAALKAEGRLGAGA